MKVSFCETLNLHANPTRIQDPQYISEYNSLYLYKHLFLMKTEDLSDEPHTPIPQVPAQGIQFSFYDRKDHKTSS